jgi:hypothetical protein
MSWLTRLLHGRTILRLAMDAVDLAHRVRRAPAAAAAWDRDPDAAFEEVVRAAAAAAGIEVSAKVVREAVGEAALRFQLARLDDKVADLQKTLGKLEKL